MDLMVDHLVETQERQDLSTASVSELEALLRTSQKQQKQLAEELDQFVLAHLDDLHEICSATDEESLQVRNILGPLNDRYEVFSVVENREESIRSLKMELDLLKVKQTQTARLDGLLAELDVCVASMINGELSSTYDKLQNIKGTLEKDEKSRRLPPEKITVLHDKASDQQAELLRHVTSIWDESFIVNKTSGLTIKPLQSLGEAVKVLHMLGMLPAKARSLAQEIFEAVMRALLTTNGSVHLDGDHIAPAPVGLSGPKGITALVEFLHERLPSEVLHDFRPHLMSLLMTCMRDDYLPRVMPSEMQANARIEALVWSLDALQKVLQTTQFVGTSNLSDLVKDIPRLWFEKRRSLILDACKQVVLTWTGTTEVIEQNENVTQESLLSAAQETLPQKPTSKVKDSVEADDDWGASEWDAPNIDEPERSHDVNDSGEDDDGTDAWGLDDDMDEPYPNTEQHGETLPSGTVVLSTKYTISTIPKALLHLIEQSKEDARKLSTGPKSSFLALQAESFSSLEAEILDLYTALVPLLIQRTGYPRMTIYNDCIYLAAESHSSIRAFGEGYYTLEIQEKLTQVETFMQQTDSFTSVTIPTQKDICYAAIQNVLDLLTRTSERYEAQLGRTTLCTALGTISDAALVYFIDSVMAMTDISESESIELAKLGDALSALENLFKSADEGETVLTAMWCPNWFRFRLLLDILEAKLDYILQLWNDGNLVDFEPGEVVELIRALFSDSPKRRNAIDKIMANV